MKDLFEITTVIENIANVAKFTRAKHLKPQIDKFYKKLNLLGRGTETNDFKPNSDKWKERQAKIDERLAEREELIASIPDYDVVQYGELSFLHNYNERLTFDIMQITISEEQPDYDNMHQEPYYEDVTYFFLVSKDRYFPQDILEYKELISLELISDLIAKSFESSRISYWRDWITECGPEDKFFDNPSSVMHDHILKCEKLCIDVSLLQNHGVRIGEKIYSKEYIEEMYKAKKSDIIYYDKSDRVIEWRSYSEDTFIEFYDKYGKQDED